MSQAGFSAAPLLVQGCRRLTLVKHFSHELLTCAGDRSDSTSSAGIHPARPNFSISLRCPVDILPVSMIEQIPCFDFCRFSASAFRRLWNHVVKPLLLGNLLLDAFVDYIQLDSESEFSPPAMGSFSVRNLGASINMFPAGRTSR